MDGNRKFSLSNEQFCLAKGQAEVRCTRERSLEVALEKDTTWKQLSLKRATWRHLVVIEQPKGVTLQMSNMKHLVVAKQSALNQAEMKLCLENKKENGAFPVIWKWMLCLSTITAIPQCHLATWKPLKKLLQRQICHPQASPGVDIKLLLQLQLG